MHISYESTTPRSTSTITLIQTTGTWLRTFTWDWYGTFTFAKPVSPKGARFVLGQYVQALKRVSKTDVSMFWTVERGPAGGHIHAHGLIGNVGAVSAFCGSRLGFCVPACGVHLWRSGKAKVAPYYSDEAAPFYICKNAFLRTGNTDFMAKGDWDIIGTPIPAKAN